MCRARAGVDGNIALGAIRRITAMYKSHASHVLDISFIIHHLRENGNTIFLLVCKSVFLRNCPPQLIFRCGIVISPMYWYNDLVMLKVGNPNVLYCP